MYLCKYTFIFGTSDSFRKQVTSLYSPNTTVELQMQQSIYWISECYLLFFQHPQCFGFQIPFGSWLQACLRLLRSWRRTYSKREVLTLMRRELSYLLQPSCCDQTSLFACDDHAIFSNVPGKAGTWRDTCCECSKKNPPLTCRALQVIRLELSVICKQLTTFQWTCQISTVVKHWSLTSIPRNSGLIFCPRQDYQE